MKKDSDFYFLYFKKISSLNVSDAIFNEPSQKETVSNVKGSSKDLDLSEYDSGCAIFRNEWSEIVLWKGNGSKYKLIKFFHSTSLQVFIFNFEKTGKFESSRELEWSDIYRIDFYYENEKIDNTDWILENGKNIKITIAIPENEDAKIEIKGNGWRKSNDTVMK